MINITIGWEWALGIFGLLILIAWKGSARLAALETSMEWVKRTLIELKVAIENVNAQKPAFGAESPIDLKPAGSQSRSGSDLRKRQE
jgi:hypothetical protein